jgi:hypothetical protein
VRSFRKDFGHNKYATKKTITQGLLDIALLTANASQLKFLLEVGESHPYYVLLLTFLAVSITLQVSHSFLSCSTLKAFHCPSVHITNMPSHFYPDEWHRNSRNNLPNCIKNLRGLSPLANYTDLEPAACRRS